MNSYLLGTHAAVYVGRGSWLNANRPLLKIPWGTDVSRRQISRTIPPTSFSRFRETDRNFRAILFFLIFLVRWLVEILVGKMDSVGFIERHVANNSIGERLKNYWQRLLMLMIHDMIMVYNYFCINFLCGFTYNRLNLIDASIQTSLRWSLIRFRIGI